MSGFSNSRAVYFARSTRSLGAEPELLGTALDKADKSQAPVVLTALGANGTVAEMNQVQPFHHRDWIFAHDGVLLHPENLSLTDTAPQGQHGSERLMHWILERVIPADDPTEAMALAIQDLRQKMEFTALTFVLSDGLRLWAYREVREKGATLFWMEDGAQVIICSEPLPPVPRWKDLPQRKLAVFPASPSLTHQLISV